MAGTITAIVALALPAAADARTRVVTHAVPLPATITKVQFPDFTADGSRIVAAAQSSAFAGMQLVTFTPTGRQLRCLTCGHWSGPPLQKVFPFPDGRRLLVRIGAQTGVTPAAHGVVECSPSVLRCRDARIVPIEAPYAGDPNVVEDQREFRISPDGRHVALFTLKPAEIAEPWINSLSAERRRRLGQPLTPRAIAAGWTAPRSSTGSSGSELEQDEGRGLEAAAAPAQRPPHVRPTRRPAWAPSLRSYFPPDPATPSSRREGSRAVCTWRPRRPRPARSTSASSGSATPTSPTSVGS